VHVERGVGVTLFLVFADVCFEDVKVHECREIENASRCECDDN